ncbi:Hypothetical predicted protein [Mytilus galloprovincialis]|uniref:C-type lectin domain-containing protein n=1 Tax=Mytilus galloprovincialis TaxID=29158 RepID=A0A8B6EMY4_MYTGA|nr:Hypothetical predicted protein [Mytilus galloprovincialis]
MSMNNEMTTHPLHVKGQSAKEFYDRAGSFGHMGKSYRSRSSNVLTDNLLRVIFLTKRESVGTLIKIAGFIQRIHRFELYIIYSSYFVSFNSKYTSSYMFYGLAAKGKYILLFATVVFCACPNSWSHYEDKCFFLSRDNETFADSLKLCEVIGRQYGRSASLATVDDAKTQQFLANLMIKINSIGMYIGLNDLVTEGEFHWIANGKQATYFNWGPT